MAMAGLLLIRRERTDIVKLYSLTASTVIFALSIGTCFYGLPYKGQLISGSSLGGLLETNFLLDYISAPFVILTTFIIPFCIMVSHTIHFKAKDFMAMLFVAELVLVNAFTVTSLLGFYIAFEAILIPFFLLVGIWGSREKERISAAYQLFIYTLVGSFLFLISLTIIYNSVGSFDFTVLKNTALPMEVELFVFITFFIALAVKVPMWPFYIWLPKAHVEAPTAGSVLLAGILLKLGSFGMIRFLYLFQEGYRYFTPLVLVISLMGIIISLLAALRQTDLKRIIAYSSISHLNYLNIGLFSGITTGLLGSYSLMLFHGIVSSGLFLAVGILYDRYKTRNIFYFRQLSTVMPIFAILFFILIMGNIGLPGTSNFISEIMIFVAAFMSNMVVAIMAMSSLFLSAVAGFWLISRVLFGNYNFQIKTISSWFSKFKLGKATDLNYRETIILSVFAILIVYIGIIQADWILVLAENQLGWLSWEHWTSYLSVFQNDIINYSKILDDWIMKLIRYAFDAYKETMGNYQSIIKEQILQFEAMINAELVKRFTLPSSPLQGWLYWADLLSREDVERIFEYLEMLLTEDILEEVEENS